MTSVLEGRVGSVGLLWLRVCAGSMMLFGHGLGKMGRFDELSTKFSDPLGVGHETSLVLAIFGEVVCAAAVVFGVFTRASAFAVMFTMLVAGFVVHGDDPFRKQELALLYATVFGALVIMGGGRYSVDRLLR